jgi:hypothetical protein
MRFHFLGVAIISCIAWSCVSLKENTVSEPTYDFTLVETDSFNLPLDTVTSSMFSTLTYVEKGNQLYVLNNATYQLNVYNLSSNSLAKKINFAKEGEDGIPTGLLGSFVHSTDSIFLTNGYMIFLANSTGKIIKKYVPEDPDLPKYSQVFFNTKDAPVVIGDTLYCVVYPYLHSLDLAKYKRRPGVYALNIRTGKGRTVSFYPAEYLAGFFGNNFTNTFVTKAPESSKQKVICSYPVSDFVYEANTDVKHLAKSKFFGPIKPASKIADTPKGHTSFFVISPSYGPIYYDPYQEIYIRVGEKPRSQDDFINKKWWKEKTLIILNKNLSIIGEIELENAYLNVYDCFATPKAFYIPVSSKEENKKSFIGFKLKKL